MLERDHCLLNSANLRPGNLVAYELRLQLAEKVETPRTIDQIRIGDGVGGAGKQIPQANLIPHICRNDDQRRVEQTGHLLEQVAKQLGLG